LFPGVNDTGDKFFAGVVDTAEQLITGVVDTGDEHFLIREYLREFSKKFKKAPNEYLGAWGTLIHEKNLKSKISCQTPLKNTLYTDGGFIRGIVREVKCTESLRLLFLKSTVPLLDLSCTVQ
jgi:hypothetical protein